MQAIALLLVAAWFYSLGTFVYFPVRLIVLRRTARNPWAFFTRRRLLVSALAYLMAAPLMGLLLLAAAAGGVSGSHASGVPDSLGTIAWGLFWGLLVAMVLALLAAWARPAIPLARDPNGGVADPDRHRPS